jgi:hypothetical protein
MQVHLTMAVIVRMLLPPVMFKIKKKKTTRGGVIKRLVVVLELLGHIHTYTNIYFFVICICHR